MKEIDALRRPALRRVRDATFLARLMNPRRAPANRAERREYERQERRLRKAAQRHRADVMKKRIARAWRRVYRAVRESNYA